MVARSVFILGRLFAPVDIASLVFFRIAFGSIMLLEVWFQFSHGLIKRDYIDPTYHFSYYGFDWVQPWSGNGMYVHFLVLGVLAACIALGFWYRVATVLFFLSFTYVFLLDEAQYLNHFYLVVLVSFLMIFVPANRSFSIDALFRPEMRSKSVPGWAPWLIAMQVGIVYFYGGLAKLNGDWLQGEPMRGWLAESTGFPLIGGLFTHEWMVYLFSYGGLLFDLLIVPLLVWRQTRLVGFALALFFHLTNAQLFNIGIFPWFAIAATTLFFPPSWPRQFVAFLRGLGQSPPRPASERGHEEEEEERREKDVLVAAPTRLRAHQWVIVSLLGVFLAVQLLVPLRHFLYPGESGWTREGDRFAWHMKLHRWEGRAIFYATDPVSGQTWEIDPLKHLTARQAVQTALYPDIALQFSHIIAESLRAEGYEQIEVRAKDMVSLDGRDYQPLIDPTVDLAGQPRTLAPASWILPLEEPLPPPSQVSSGNHGTSLE